MARLLAIHDAAKRGDVHAVTTSLRNHPSIHPDVLDSEEFTPLFYACCEGHSRVTKVLIEAGADVNFKCGELELTPLHAAGRMGHYRMFRQLVEAGGDLSVRTSNGVTFLHIVVLGDCPAGVRELVELGADVDAQDAEELTALMTCAYNNRGKLKKTSAMAKILMEAGARADIVGPNGYTALLFGAHHGNHGVVRVLLDAGACVSDRMGDGCTALMLAAEHGNLLVMRLLIAAGANTASSNFSRQTALHYAAFRSHPNVVPVLLGEGCLETVIDAKGCRPACCIGKTWMATWMATDPSKDTWIRHLLAQGPAFRARSWLWPTESATETAEDADSSSSGKEARLDGGATKVRVGVRALRHRREDRRPVNFMAIFSRYANQKGAEFQAKCTCVLCDKSR